MKLWRARPAAASTPDMRPVVQRARAEMGGARVKFRVGASRRVMAPSWRGNRKGETQSA